jgi:hypothetical protein
MGRRRRRKKRTPAQEKKIEAAKKKQGALNEKYGVDFDFDPNEAGFRNSKIASDHRRMKEKYNKGAASADMDDRIAKQSAKQSISNPDVQAGLMQQYGGGQSPKGQQGQGGGSPKGQPQMQNNSGAQPGSYMDRMRNSRAEQGVGGYEQFAPTQAPQGGSPKGGGGSPKGQPQAQSTRSMQARRRPQGRPNPYQSQGYQQPATRRRAYNPETGLIE